MSSCGGEGPAVLVVDDEPLNRDLVRRLLGPGLAVLEAGDGEAALALLAREREAGRDVAVALCDHLMPGMNGTDLARAIRGRWPDVVCILLTGYDDAPEVEAARREGCVRDVVAKPFTLAALRRALDGTRAATGR